ncbi:hypothetical protein B0H10DRAFT_1961643 [Mycena sp. CBHHK59/15]|nr:hypothetical protein B0H10DRAFT_1961643 [Mycena sp. CBHHK59/15]
MWVSVKGEDGEVIITDLEEPSDIIKLCEALVAIVPDANMKVTLPMLGHVALLRQILVEVNGGAKFWEKVDEQLSKLRTKYENDKKQISKAIAKVLKAATSASEVSMFAQMLKVTEMQALLSPAAAAFTIPKKLDNKIDVHSIRTLLSPTLCHYVKKAGGDTPSGIMKSLIQEHATTWGLTADNVDDKNQWGVVTTRVRTRLTDWRYEIKKVLCDAMWVSVKGEDGEVIITDLEEPSDIIKLCEALVAIVPDANMKVTLPMLGHVALLRQILVEVNGGAKFWEKVDEQLSKLRTKYENDKKQISKAIAKVLKAATSASEVSMFAQMLKVTEMQALLSPAAAAFTIPKKLDMYTAFEP